VTIGVIWMSLATGTLHFGGVPLTNLRIVFDIAYDMDVG